MTGVTTTETIIVKSNCSFPLWARRAIARQLGCKHELAESRDCEAWLEIESEHQFNDLIAAWGTDEERESHRRKTRSINQQSRARRERLRKAAVRAAEKSAKKAAKKGEVG